MLDRLVDSWRGWTRAAGAGWIAVAGVYLAALGTGSFDPVRLLIAAVCAIVGIAAVARPNAATLRAAIVLAAVVAAFYWLKTLDSTFAGLPSSGMDGLATAITLIAWYLGRRSLAVAGGD